jgi:trehalose-phosphatase
MIVEDRILERFWARLRTATAGILMLDYDGTLAPFTQQRDSASPYPGVEERLERLSSSCRTRLVVVTGRQIDDLLRLLPLARKLEVWGSHGLERKLADGRVEVPDIGPGPANRLRQAREASAQLGLAAFLEEKPGCMAQHWRGIGDPFLAQMTAELLPIWSRLAGRGLQLREFDGGIELRSSLANKSRAVEWVRHGTDRRTLIAYLGDDLTDEDAFRVLRVSDLGVLVRPEYRSTQAQVWLKPPEQLLGFLDSWLAAVGLAEEGRHVAL